MRLQQSRDFSRIKLQGRRLTNGCLIGNWSELPAGVFCRLGVVTSKKLGHAPVRSRARRLLREVFRQHQHDFVRPVDLVLIARSSIVHKSYAEVEKDFLALLRRGGLLNNAD